MYIRSWKVGKQRNSVDLILHVYISVCTRIFPQRKVWVCTQIPKTVKEQMRHKAISHKAAFQSWTERRGRKVCRRFDSHKFTTGVLNLFGHKIRFSIYWGVIIKQQTKTGVQLPEDTHTSVTLTIPIMPQIMCQSGSFSSAQMISCAQITNYTIYELM